MTVGKIQFNTENAKMHCFLVAAILFFIGKIIIINNFIASLRRWKLFF